MPSVVLPECCPKNPLSDSTFYSKPRTYPMLFLLNESISKNWQVKVAHVNRVDYLRQFDLAKRRTL